MTADCCADDCGTLLRLPNGVVVIYSFEAGSQLTGITYMLGTNTLGNLTYAYDLAGRRTAVGGSYARTGTPQAASAASYNVNNQLTQWKGASLTYDANGNLTSDGTNTYTWNARNQLVSISGGASASFQYDPFGRRVSKTIGGTTQYLYDAINPVQEISGTTASANLLTGGVDEYFQRTDSAGARSFLTDALGSTLGLTDGTGTIQTSYSFEPFGNTSVAGSATSNSFAYTGRELDAGNLYFYRARYYSPTLQRFISEDPIEFWGGINFYAYADNSPTDEVDPQGEEGATLALGEAGCLLGPEGCLGGAIIGALVDLTIATAAAVAAYKAAQALKNADLRGDDIGYTSPEALAATIAELERRLLDETLSQREREAIRRRLKELRRRPAQRKHGADKKDFFPGLPGINDPCTSMAGRKCGEQ
ncbi:MAG TPA: RHS repeat-associated core domain-containing protein [Candidatus Acidoferrales bacterium]